MERKTFAILDTDGLTFIPRNMHRILCMLRNLCTCKEGSCTYRPVNPSGRKFLAVSLCNCKFLNQVEARGKMPSHCIKFPAEPVATWADIQLQEHLSQSTTSRFYEKAIASPSLDYLWQEQNTQHCAQFQKILHGCKGFAGSYIPKDHLWIPKYFPQY